MAKQGGKLLIKFRDPVAASFSSKDIVLNASTGTIFYKRNRELFQIRGTPDNFELVVFPGQSANQQILINDSGDMQGTDEFRFKLSGATCGCANTFMVGVDTLTHFSGSVRIGEQLPTECNLLPGHSGSKEEVLKVFGSIATVENLSYTQSGHITASGNISSSQNFIGANAFIDTSIFHTNNATTNINFDTDTIHLAVGGNIATITDDRLTVNSGHDLYIPGTDSLPSALTSSDEVYTLVMSGSDGRVYYTGSYQGETFKKTGQRDGNAFITGSLFLSGSGTQGRHLTASGEISASQGISGSALFAPNTPAHPNSTAAFSLLTLKNGQIMFTSSTAIGGNAGSGTDIEVKDEGVQKTAAVESFDFVGTGVTATNAGADITVTVPGLAVENEGTDVGTTNATVIDFRGNAVEASLSSGEVKVDINAVTESVWFDGRPSFVSQSAKVLMDQAVGIGAFHGNPTTIVHDLHISASTGFADDIADIGLEGPLSHGGQKTKFSLGVVDGPRIGFFIKDHAGDGNSVIFIHTSGSGGGKTSLRETPPAIEIFNAIKTETSSVSTGNGVSPNFGSTGGNQTGSVPVVVIDPFGFETGSVAKFHVNTRNTDFNRHYNGLVVGPPYDPDNISGQKSGSGLFIHLGGKYSLQSESPKVLGKVEPGTDWANTTPLIIESETDREDSYPGSFDGGVGRAPSIFFSARDISGVANSASLAGGGIAAGGQEHTASMSEVFGNGTFWINGTAPHMENSNLLYNFHNDQMGLFAIEASGRVGIGNFAYNRGPKSLLHMAAKSGSHADIRLATNDPDDLQRPIIDFTLGSHKAGIASVEDPFKFGAEISLVSPTQSHEYTLFNDQKPQSFYIESKGVVESTNLSTNPYPFNISGAAAGHFHGANNIQLVVGGDDSTFANSISASNGKAALTVVGAADFRRIGEVGIGLINPSSSLHVTNSVQANNFRTTDPVTMSLDADLKTINGSNQVEGTSTTFTNDFIIGDAIKISGRGTIMSLTGGYTASNGSQTASVSNSGVSAGTPGDEIIVGDMILISTGSSSETGSYHIVESFQSTGGNNLILFTPAYLGSTTQSTALIHRVNPNYYQISTVNGIHSDTSMSIEDNWTGNSYILNAGFKENILFEVKTADYNPRFTVFANGNVSASGTASFGFIDIDGSSIDTFKTTGQREGDSFITGSLFLSGSSGHLTASGNISASGVGKHFLGGDTFINGDITGSNELLIQKSSGEGTPTFGTSNVAVFQNNDNNQDASIAIIASDSKKSQIHFGKHDDIDVGGFRYFHEDHANPDQLHVRIASSRAAVFAPHSDQASKMGLRLGGDETGANDDFLNIQGNLGGKGLTISSSDGTRLKFARGANNNQQLFEYSTGVTRNWSLGNAGESNDNFYIYNTDSNVKFIELVDQGNSTHIHTNVTASGHASASGNLFASASLSNDVNFKVLVYDTASGKFFHTGSYGAAGGGGLIQSVGNTTGQTGISLNIDGSGQLTAVANGVETTDSVQFHQISASSNVSASGTLQAGLTSESNRNLVYYDDATGELTFENTGSFNFGNTFKSTGQRFGKGDITGSLFVSGADHQLHVQTLNPTPIHIKAQTDATFPTSLNVRFQNAGGDVYAGVDVDAGGNNMFGIGTNQDISTDPVFIARMDTKNVGIGTELPGKKLEVIGDISASGELHISASESSTDMPVLLFPGNSLGGKIHHTSSAGLVGGNTFKGTGHRSGDSVISGSLFLSGSNSGGHLTASGNISASGGISSSNLDVVSLSGVTDSGNIKADGYVSASALHIEGPSTPSIVIKDSTNPEQIKISQANQQATIDLTGGSGQLNDLAITTDHRTNHILVDGDTGDILLGGHIEVKGGGAGANSAANVVATGYIEASGSLIETNHVTASGNISASENIYGDAFYLQADEKSGIDQTINNDLFIKHNVDGKFVRFTGNDSGGSTNIGATINYLQSSVTLGDPVTSPFNVTASANISASGDITAFNISASGNLFISASQDNYSNVLVYSGLNNGGKVHFTSSAGLSSQLDTFKQTGQRGGNSSITGSLIVTSDISGSGKLFFSSSLNSDVNFKTLVYDTATGQIFHTGSYAAGGGGGGVLQTVSDTTGQTGIDLELDGSGDLTATVTGLTPTSSVQFNNITGSNISASGTIRLETNGSYVDPDSDNAVIVGAFNNSANADNLGIYTNDGLVRIGPQTAGFNHIITDRPASFFQVDNTTNGQEINFNFDGLFSGDVVLASHGPDDLILRRDYDDTNKNEVRIKNASYQIISNNSNRFEIASGGTVTMAANGGDVGIGTSAPTKKLTVHGGISGSKHLYISASEGNYSEVLVYSGINNGGQIFATSSAALSAQLDTFKQTGQRNGDAAITGSLEITGSNEQLFIDTSNPSPIHIKRDSSDNSNIQYTNNVSDMFAGIDSIAGSNIWAISNNQDLSTSTLLAVETGGNVGIGTNAPTEKLQVEGNVLATHISASGNISASGTGRFGNDVTIVSGSLVIDTTIEGIKFAGNGDPTNNQIRYTSADNLQLDFDGNVQFSSTNADITNGADLMLRNAGNTNTMRLTNEAASGTGASAGRIDIQSGTTAKVSITGSKDGRIGIGTTTPKKALHIEHSGILIDGGTAHDGTGFNERFIIDAGASTAHTFLKFKNDNGDQLTIDGTGTVSASGALFFSSSLNSDTGFKLLAYDEATGQVFHTGSYAALAGGGGDNLGNHTASVNLNMSNKDIENTDNIFVSGSIFHGGDISTGIDFSSSLATKRVDLFAGNKIFLRCNDGGSDTVQINPGNSDIDFMVRGQATSTESNNLIRTDAVNERVGIRTNSPTSALHVVGDISASGDIRVVSDAFIENILTVEGNINANGNIVGDDSTDITNIDAIECSEVIHNGNTTNRFTFGNDTLTYANGSSGAGNVFVIADADSTSMGLMGLGKRNVGFASNTQPMNTLHIKIKPGSNNTHDDYNSGILITRDDSGTSPQGTQAGDLLGSIAFDSDDPGFEESTNFKAATGMFGIANQTHQAVDHGAFLTFRTKTAGTDGDADSQETAFIGPNNNSALGVSLGLSGSMSASGGIFANLVPSVSSTHTSFVTYNPLDGEFADSSTNPFAHSITADNGGVTFSTSPVIITVFGGSMISTDRFQQDITVNFEPGGTDNGIITSNSGAPGGGATVETGLTFDGATLRCSGDIVAFSTTSDKRFKDNIKPISNPIKKILQIGGYEFNWNEKQDMYEGPDVGVIAQEVEKILPSAVTTRENGYKAMKYEKIIPLLIEGMKEQQKQIDELKELVNKLTK